MMEPNTIYFSGFQVGTHESTWAGRLTCYIPEHKFPYHGVTVIATTDMSIKDIGDRFAAALKFLQEEMKVDTRPPV